MKSESPVALAKLRKALQQVGDPARAPVMQAYMKSAMPYHGVPTPLLRQVCKATFAGVEFATASQWQSQVLGLWRNARFREERYAALYLAGDKRARPFQTTSAMKMYDELIATGAW
jgi:3-methyladenine DNA glycosylase AlkD